MHDGGKRVGEVALLQGLAQRNRFHALARRRLDRLTHGSFSLTGTDREQTPARQAPNPSGRACRAMRPLGDPYSVNGSAFVLPYRRGGDLRRAGGNPTKAILVAAAMLGAS